MGRAFVRVLTAALPAVFLVVFGAVAADWQAYRNARFGFAVEYPAGLLTMQPPPANDDGRVFSAPDRRIEVIASASHNVLEDSIGQLYTKALARYGPGNVSYRRQGSSFYVVSGIAGGRVFYEYVQIARKGGSEYVGSLLVRYPAEEKAVMDRVVTRMQRRFATSFRQMPAGG